MVKGAVFSNGGLTISSADVGLEPMVRFCIKEGNAAAAIYIWPKEVWEIISALEEILVEDKKK